MASRQHDSDVDLDKLRKQVEQLHSDLASVSKSLKAFTSNGMGFNLEPAKEAIVEMRYRAKRTADTISHTIEGRPLSSALLLFGVGILIGNLLNRWG